MSVTSCTGKSEISHPVDKVDKDTCLHYIPIL